MTHGASPWLVATAGVAASFLALPVLVLVARAVFGGSLLEAVAAPAVLDALVLSAATTTASLLIVLVFGTPLAVYLATSSGRAKVLLETAVDLPIVLPPSVAGLALLLVFGSRGVIGSWFDSVGLAIPFTTFAVVLAQVFVSAPFYVRAARAGFTAVDHDLQDAARVDGAAERNVFRWITVPLAAPALAAGMVTTWARALGEFGATIMFAGAIQGVTQTLPLVVYGEFQSSDLEASIAAAIILVLAAAAALLLVRSTHWATALDSRAGA
jgi:molybdate transport system permease protein